MADHFPFDIQIIILKKLPAKSLIRFRCVSNQWKSLIDSSDFIKKYQKMNVRHLLARFDREEYIADKDKYLSITDNDAFPEHMSLITVPLSIKTLLRVTILGSSYGIICFRGYHIDFPNRELVVFWNPSIRKSVSVPVQPRISSLVAFGVLPQTRNPKLVIIDDVGDISEVQVYTLSTRAWRKVSLKQPYTRPPSGYRPRGRRYRNEAVCVEGFIYWLERDDLLPPFGNGSNSIVSFDLSNDEFGKVCIPNSLLHTKNIMLSKWNECLIVFEYSYIYGHSLNFWDVWMMKDDGVTQSFTMIFRIESNYPKYYNVLEFRKNGEAIIETRCANNDDVDLILQVYDPCSGCVTDIGLPWSGRNDFEYSNVSRLSMSSYMETLLLLDHDGKHCKV